MILALILALAGLVLVFCEFFLPGGIMGIFGALLLVASVIVLSKTGVGPFFLLIYVLVIATLLTFCIKFALKRVKRTGKKGTMFLESDQEGFTASSFNKDLIGKKGVVSSDLKPSGHITIEEDQYQALSRGGYIERGTKIEIIGGRGAYLICKRINKE